MRYGSILHESIRFSIIVQSQPQCNNILLAGSALCSASLFLMGLPTAGVQLTDGEFTLLCHVSHYLEYDFVETTEWRLKKMKHMCEVLREQVQHKLASCSYGASLTKNI